MEVLFVRHAIAEERDSAKWPDDRNRPLTRAGIRRFEKVAGHLRKIVPSVDGVWSSPLTRAWQTAKILEEKAGWPAPRELEALEPEAAPRAVLAFLREHEKSERVVLVGHEPSMHLTVSHLLVGSPEGVGLEMKKGGAVLIGFDGSVAAGAAMLYWLLPPRVVPGIDD
jgi:phosphohistidine phosphatase